MTSIGVLFVPSSLSLLSAEFDLSASTKNTASSPMLLSIQIEAFDENTKIICVPLKSRSSSAVLYLMAFAISLTPLLPILLSGNQESRLIKLPRSE